MKLGDTVVYKQGDGEFHYNNSQYHPAIVTKVNDDGTCNLFIMLDGAGVERQKSVPVGSTQDDGACCIPLHDYENQIAGPFPDSGPSGE